MLLLPARIAGGTGAGLAGRPVAKPKFNLGVRSHMLLIFGVNPPPPLFVFFMPSSILSVELGLECADCEPLRIKSVRAARDGS